MVVWWVGGLVDWWVGGLVEWWGGGVAQPNRNSDREPEPNPNSDPNPDPTPTHLYLMCECFEFFKIDRNQQRCDKRHDHTDRQTVLEHFRAGMGSWWKG